MLAKATGQRGSPFGGHFRLVADKESNQLGAHKFGGGGLLKDNPQPVVAVEWTRFPEHLLYARIVLIRIELNDTVVNFPAGKAAGQLLDVLLAVVSEPQAEELHHLAGEILVGMVFSV